MGIQSSSHEFREYRLVSEPGESRTEVTKGTQWRALQKKQWQGVFQDHHLQDDHKNELELGYPNETPSMLQGIQNDPPNHQQHGEQDRFISLLPWQVHYQNGGNWWDKQFQESSVLNCHFVNKTSFHQYNVCVPECFCIVNSAGALGSVLHNINQKVVSIEGQYVSPDIKITNLSESSIPTKTLLS